MESLVTKNKEHKKHMTIDYFQNNPLMSGGGNKKVTHT